MQACSSYSGAIDPWREWSVRCWSLLLGRVRAWPPLNVWCRPALGAPMERQGTGERRGGESATKKRRPRRSQRRNAARLYALKKGRGRAKGQFHNLAHTTSELVRGEPLP